MSGVPTPRRWLAAMGFLLLLFFAALALAVLLGSTIPVSRVLQPWDWSESEREAIVFFRLPRALVAAGVGMALGVAGASLQAVLANPLVEPYLLGMASGGSLFVALGVFFGLASSISAAGSLAPLAFPGALLAGVIVLAAARMMGLKRTTGVILVGIMVNALFGALVQLIYYQSDVYTAKEVLTWMMGRLPAYPTFGHGAGAMLVGVAGGIVLSSLARPLNLMMLGEEPARAAGVDTMFIKRVVFVVAALVTASAVALAGPLGFVGLVVPHLIRLGFGPDNRLVVPGAALLGGAFVMAADAVSRYLISVNPLPVGVVTSLVGCPVFLWLLWRERRRPAGA